MSVAPEVKRRAGFNPNQPRDRKGRWVETGAEVRNSITNAVGRVVKINQGDAFHETTYDVQTADGKTHKWETSAVDVVRNRDGSAPTAAKPGTPAAQAETAAGAPGGASAAPGVPRGPQGGTQGLDDAIGEVFLPPSGSAPTTLSDGTVVEPVQVTQLQSGDKIRKKPGTLNWVVENAPMVDGDFQYLDGGTVASVADAGSMQTGAFGSGTGYLDVTFDDGKVVRFNKISKVHREMPPVQAAIEQVYDPPEGGGPKTAETAGLLTEAQQIAIKQKWKLPTGPVADLQAQLAAVEQAETPSVADLVDQGMSAADATKEAKRLARNAQVNAWRARTKLQAAIDTALAKDVEQGPALLQKDVASGKLDAPEPEAPLTLPEPAPAAEPEPPAAPPDPTAEAAAADFAESPDYSGMGGAHAPTALYSVSDAQMDSGVYGPGGIFPGHAWHDQFIAYAGENSKPIPVVHLQVQGAYTVESGWAQTINGRAFLVEMKPGESAEDAGARMHAAAAMLDAVLQFAPKEHHGVQRGIALLNGANPQDAYWAKHYGFDGFKSDAIGGNGTTTFFNGTAPDPALLAHEYGHNVDSNSHLSSNWLSTLASPSLPGQQMSWQDAISTDVSLSSFYDGRFIETRPGKPIVLGKGGVTDYAQSSVKEDFAESVRLWLRDRRYGKVGYDPTTGDNIRFADLFPERAKILDARFGTKTDFNTPARAKRKAEMKFEITQAALNANDLGQNPPWNDIDSTWSVGEVGITYGLDAATATDVFAEAIKEFEAKLEAENAKKAAAAAAKAKVDAALAAKKAAEQVQSFEEAYKKGLLSKSERDKLTGRRRARAYHLRKAGVPAAEAEAQARAWEQAYIAEHWPQSQGPTVQPWQGVQISPKLSGSGTSVGTGFIETGGTTVHPLAKKQYGAPQQAKANIAAELASRLNNPSDWEIFRDYRRNLHARMGGPGGNIHSSYGGPIGPNGEDLATLGPFEQYSDEQRQQILDKEVAGRIQMWAVSSGDENEPAVVMQMAAKDEFGLEVAHPAPRMSQTAYEKWTTDFYTAEVQVFYRRFLRVQYEHTQEQLAAAGIKRVKLYRGMSFNGDKPDWAVPDGKAKRPQLQPLNSWSTKRATAKSFSSNYGGVVFEASIPAELVVGTASTGFGCQHEFEYVVMDADGAAVANNYAGTYKYKED